MNNNKKMHRVFYNKTRNIFPRVNLTVTNFKNIKTTYSYPVLNGEWLTKYNRDLFYSRIICQENLIINSSNIIRLDNVRDIFIHSYDFEKLYKFEMSMENKKNAIINVNIDDNSDTITSIKIF